MVKHVLLLSNPRTGCNLLERMLSKQPDVSYVSHPFVWMRPAQVESLQDPLPSELSPELRDKFQKAFDQGYGDWEATMKKAAETGEIVFTHTHPHFILVPEITWQYSKNPTQPLQINDHGWTTKPGEKSTTCTVVPDSFYLDPNTVPLITIRHPALAVRTIYRTLARARVEGSSSRSALLVACSLAWSKQLYDWYVARGVTPLVLDADDYMTSKPFMRELCLATGLDPDSVIYSWPKTSEEEMQQMQPPQKRFVMKRLLESSGVVAGLDAKNLVMEDEVAKWREEFGEEGVREIQELLDLNMPIYTYMKERRFRGGEK